MDVDPRPTSDKGLRSAQWRWLQVASGWYFGISAFCQLPIFRRGIYAYVRLMKHAEAVQMRSPRPTCEVDDVRQQSFRVQEQSSGLVQARRSMGHVLERAVLGSASRAGRGASVGRAHRVAASRLSAPRNLHRSRSCRALRRVVLRIGSRTRAGSVALAVRRWPQGRDALLDTAVLRRGGSGSSSVLATRREPVCGPQQQLRALLRVVHLW